MNSGLQAALDALAPARVVLENGPEDVLREVTSWVARQRNVGLTRDGTHTLAPGDLLTTGSDDRALQAVRSGCAVLVSADVAAPAGCDVQELPERLKLLSPAGRAYLDVASSEPQTIRPSVTIVIPVHNAAAELARCLESLQRNTTWPAELVLVDDASTDPAIDQLLAETLASGVCARVLRNSVNLGFTATVNRGLRATSGDVVVLNSDTEVGPRWLERLHDAAYRRPGTGSATPVSDNAGAFAVPEIGEPNPLPLHLDVDGATRVVAQAVGDALVATPTANGFCMYLRRDMLADVGLLDEEAFPRGYGEENDLSMRAAARGWRHVVDPGTFVHHVRKASFGSEKQGLAVTARAVIDERYPHYTDEVAAFVASPGMKVARERVADALADRRTPLPRVLFVIQEGGGGTPLANFELMAGLEGKVECLLFTSDRRSLRLDRVIGSERFPIGEWQLDDRIRVLDFTRRDYRAVIENILRQQAIDLVHVRHLFKHTFDAPSAAEALGIPVVFSFHDFYFVCPTVNLLDNRDRYCAGLCTPGDGECRVPPAGLEGLPPLKHAFVHQWREEVGSVLAGVDAFVTTSEHAREVHRRALPSIGERRFELIPHGRSLSQASGVAVAPVPGDRVRIAIAGNLEVHKGADYLREVKRADSTGRLDLHFFGDVPDRYRDLGTVHGRYRADQLPALIAAIKPAMIGMFSICAETFSHSLTEAWAMGVPVVATDIGAFGERLREHEGGWLVPVDDAEAVVRRVLSVADDPDEYETQLHRADLRGLSSVADMADSYLALYTEVLDDRRTLVPPAGRRPRAPKSQRSRGTRRVTAIVPGSDGVHPGSTYVRIVQPLSHPSVTRRLPTRIRYAADGEPSADTELTVIQRTAVPPEQTELLISDLRLRGTPLVVDLDDHLLLKDELDLDYAAHQGSLEALLAAAALVTVSTPALLRAISELAPKVVLVPNFLDERLFLAGIDGPPLAAPRRAGDPVRLVYVGSPTHAGDLALLEPVLAELNRDGSRRFTLEVVGVQAAEADGHWFERLTIPDPCKPYPRFVGWLREQRARWDIALAPLADTRFNSFKSDLKWLEYSALGMPVVASDREPYAAVSDGGTGRLVGDDSSAWADAVRDLAEAPNRAREIAHAAFDELTRGRLLRSHAEEMTELLLAVEGGHRG